MLQIFLLKVIINPLNLEKYDSNNIKIAKQPPKAKKQHATNQDNTSKSLKNTEIIS